ncbi:MAG TPA: histidine kinase [Acidimicrobiales bacterium]
MTPEPGAGGLRPRASILYKVVGVLVVTLVVSSVVTAFIASRLTSNALDSQAARIASSQLNVLKEAFDLRGEQLLASMRNLAGTVNNGGLAEPDRRSDLISELKRASVNFELDVIRVVDASGAELADAVGVGMRFSDPAIFSDRSPIVEPASRLLATTDGKFVQAIAVAVGPGPGRPVLVGGYFFDDAFAFRLRNQILDNVLLVVSGRVAGTSLPDPPQTPPGQEEGDEGRLPTDPTVVRIGGKPGLVAYEQVGRNADDPAGGALGVVLTNPITPLQRSLSNTRLLASVLLTLVALGLGWILFRALIKPLVLLASTAGQVAGGDADATFVRRGKDEIGMLAGSLEHMRLELKSRLDLITRQAVDLQESSQRIVAAQDEERQRLSRDLHDGIQQQLVVLRMQVGMLQDGIGPDGDDPVRAFDSLGAELDRVIEQLREVTHNLYPSILVDRGLSAALHSYVGRLPLSTVVSCEPEDFPRLTPEIESGAYFLLGEAVTNALKHARATRIDIGLRLADGWLEVTVTDDGVGFHPDQAGRRGGLLHMEDRVRSFGGELTIASQLSGGTRVAATFPQRVGVETATPG